MQEIKVKHPIIISFSAGATVNLGNYQSMKVNVGLSVPVYDASKLDEAYAVIIKKVEDILEKKVEEYKKKGKVKLEDYLLVEDL